jgi:predicted ATP-grasp superfamily ATP-dependent carboligase
MTPVLVTDGEQRAALAIVRSLGRAGYAPYVCSSSRRPLAGGSRSIHGEALVPDPLEEPREYLAAIGDLIGRWRIQVLVPVAEASLLVLLPARSQLAVTLPFADLEDFLAISDKARLTEIAAAMGIAVPRQWPLEEAARLGELEPESLPYPLVIKPSRSIGGAGGHGAPVRSVVRHAADPAELVRQLATIPVAAFPVLLQQRIIGPGTGVFLLIWQGELVAAFAHRRLREKPPAGGVSVYSESIPLDPGLLEASVSLVERFRWSGPAMVEYKVDQATGRPYLMEVNGRFWGSLQLAIDAGVDFPALHLAAVLGRPFRPLPEYRAGLRLRWWWGDVDHLLLRLRRSPAALSLPSGAPGRLAAVREFLTTKRGSERSEVLRRGDPWPFARETMDWLRRLRG